MSRDETKDKMYCKLIGDTLLVYLLVPLHGIQVVTGEVTQRAHEGL